MTQLNFNPVIAAEVLALIEDLDLELIGETETPVLS